MPRRKEEGLVGWLVWELGLDRDGNWMGWDCTFFDGMALRNGMGGNGQHGKDLDDWWGEGNSDLPPPLDGLYVLYKITGIWMVSGWLS